MTFEEWYNQSGCSQRLWLGSKELEAAYVAGFNEALKERDDIHQKLINKWLRITFVFHANPSDEEFGKIVKGIINDIR